MRDEERELIERRAARLVHNALVAIQPRDWEAVREKTRSLTLEGLWHIGENRGNQRAYTFGWARYDNGQGYSWGAAHENHENGERNFSTDPARRARLWEAKINGGVLWHILDQMRWLSRRWPDDRIYLTEQQQADRAAEIQAAVYRVGEAWAVSATEALTRSRQRGSSPNFPHYEQVIDHMERSGRQITRIGIDLLDRVAPHLQPR